MRARFLLTGLTIATLAAGCSKPEPTHAVSEQENSSEPSRAAAGPVDACSLLTSEEVQAVQGEPIKGSTPRRTEKNGFVISQCVLELPTAGNSLTIRLVERGSGEDAQDPKKAWKDSFERGLESAMEEEGEGVAPPEKVAGIGDEAFWLGGAKSGGLYVLKGNRYFRLSVGGVPNQATKIEKAKVLSASILRKL